MPWPAAADTRPAAAVHDSACEPMHAPVCEPHASSARCPHGPRSPDEEAELAALVRADYERCHPEDTFDDLRRRAAFSKADKGLLRDWLAVAARRLGTGPQAGRTAS